MSVALPPTKTPLRARASRNAFTYICVGLDTATNSERGLASAATWPRMESRFESGDALEADARLAARGDRGDAVVHHQAAAERRQADDGAVTGALARADHHLDLVLVVLQRANGRAVPVGQVVPRPAQAPAGLRKPAVVAHQLARHLPQPLGRQLLRPVVERAPSLGMARVDGGIAVRRHHQVAVEHAVGVDGSGGVDAGGELEVPAQALGRRASHQQLLDGGRHLQAVRVQAVEGVAFIQRLERDRPLRVVHVRRGEDGRQIGAETR